jgi:hypothetical protein
MKVSRSLPIAVALASVLIIPATAAAQDAQLKRRDRSSRFSPQRRRHARSGCSM